ncbi:MAG TPA: trigger factor [Gammaproteobacteria bacterium]|nr:trigger factor [Gammaproteobacteria bacterium]
MEVSIESVSNIERRMTVQVPAEQISSEVESRLRSMTGKVEMKGFRPGKVPLKVVKQRYGKGVYQEVLGEVVQKSFQEAVTQEKLKPAGMPAIEPIASKAGEALEYVATFEVYPEFEIVDMSGLEITRPQVEVGDADVDAMLENLQKQRQTWESVDRPAAEGDQVVMDFDGYIDDEAFEGGAAKGVPVVIGQGRMVPGFEEQLIGASAGENVTLNVTFPEDYAAEHLAGKEARFEAKINEVNAPVLPPIDEAFAKAFGVEDGSVDQLRSDIKENMNREMTQAVRARLKNSVMDQLYEKHELDVPQALINEEIKRLKEQAAASGGQQSAVSYPDEIFVDEAKKRVSLGLIVGNIIRDNDIQLDPEQVEVTLDELASSYEDAEEFKQYYRTNREQMAGVEAMVLESQVVDWVVDQMQVSDQPMSFDELMNPAKTEK